MKGILLTFFLFVLLSSSFSQTGTNHVLTLNDSSFKVGDIMYLRDWPMSFGITGQCYPDYKDPYYIYLDSIANFILKNKNIKFEIAMHTDNRPIPLTNDTLTKRRIETIKEFFVYKGVDPSRIIAIGYGGRIPRVLYQDTSVNINTKTCANLTFFFKSGTVLTDDYIKTLKTDCEKEASYRLNRRTTLKIIGIKKK